MQQCPMHATRMATRSAALRLARRSGRSNVCQRATFATVRSSLRLQPPTLYTSRTLPSLAPTSFLSLGQRQQQRRSLWIQTESTPNADALKFVPAGSSVLPESVAGTVEYLSGREAAASSPLARKLFAVDGVASVFFGRDFVTVTKGNEASWHILKPEIFALLMEHLTAGEPVVLLNASGQLASSSDGIGGANVTSDTAVNEEDSEVVSMIKELLDTRIRPSIQEDGGDIEYRGFIDGVVRLKLRGACRTCDSSTVTLKNGIESMLMHYVPEVEAVEQVLDPEDQVAQDTFEDFEKGLREKRRAAEALGAPAN